MERVEIDTYSCKSVRKRRRDRDRPRKTKGRKYHLPHTYTQAHWQSYGADY